MLLGQQVLDNAYFSHYYYNGHFLSIMKMYNPQETCCYARPASVVINSNTGLKCWPCRGTTPSDQFQAFLTECTDTTVFAWILGVSQLQKRVKQKHFTWILSPVITKYLRPYFQNLVDKGFIWDVWTPSCINFSYQTICLHHRLCNMHTICCLHYVGKNLAGN